MPEHRDGRAIIAEAFCQMGSEGVRTAAKLAIGQPLISADVCDRIRSRKSPMIDLLEEIHSKTLINKRRRGKVASTVDRD